MSKPFDKIAVVGSGQMGRGIAVSCAMFGCEVGIIGADGKDTEQSLSLLDKEIESFAVRGSFSQAEALVIRAKIVGLSDFQELDRYDIVLEAVPENLQLKQSVFKHIEKHVADSVILASNSSSLSISDIASACEVPKRVMGIHFFNPVVLMKFVELVEGSETGAVYCSKAKDFITSLGKVSISVKDRPGFVVNRILIPMINEAIEILNEGVASAEDIDSAMKLGCNHPMGPLKLADLIGLDTVLLILERLHQGFADDKYKPSQLLRDKVSSGALGRKSKLGFFDYSKKPDKNK